MKHEFTAEERKLLNAKNPKEYIDLSLKSKLSSGRKAAITRYWLEKKKYTVEDIQYARNRHPYWKLRKMEGTAKRNQVRFLDHDYSSGVNIVWNTHRIEQFINSNKKDKKGNYIYKDWELAKHFKCSIAAVQHLRRKYNMSIRIIQGRKETITMKRLVESMIKGENILRAMKKKKK